MRFSIIKREPSYFFENIHEDLNRFLKDTFGDIEFTDTQNNPIKRAFRPAVEIKEKNNEYNVKIELPSVNKEDINVELSKNALAISAESRFEECKDDENIKMTEFRYGKFSRVIPFENKINMDEAKSEFKNGVLYVTLPKLEESKKEDIKKLTIN